MRVCIPVREDRGLQSTPYGHFGSAPYFLIFDTQSYELHAIPGKTVDHAIECVGFLVLKHNAGNRLMFKISACEETEVPV